MDDDMQWSRDVHPGWAVAVRPDADGWWYAVRNDGRIVEARRRESLMGRMVAEDVISTWRKGGML